MTEPDPKPKATPVTGQAPKPKTTAPPPALSKSAPKAPPKPAAPVPSTPAGRAALERHGVNADWDAIAAAAIKASGLEAELETLRERHHRLTQASHQVCDNVSPLFAALARER